MASKINKCLVSVILIVMCCVGNGFLVQNLKEGSKCLHNQTQTAGVCVSLTQDCEYARLNFLNNDIDPEICGYSGPGGRDIIICCPNVQKVVQSDTPDTIPDTRIKPNKGTALNQKWCATYAKEANKTNPVTGHSMCGLFGQLIFGGTEAKGKEFPHMALVGFGDLRNPKWNCGGTLISDRWVLTAAHCVFTSDFGPANYVRLGELNYKETTDDASPEDFQVIDRVTHPNHQYNQYDDIGLLKLDRPAVFSEYIRPACLWNTREIRDKRGIATGWGTVSFTGEPSPHLLKVVLHFKSFKECSDTFPPEDRLPRGIDDNLQFCAGSGPNEEKKDSCTGDSGGPLQVPADPDFFCMYYVVGITSFGKPCGIVKRPSAYTRVSYYVDWIESIVWS